MDKIIKGWNDILSIRDEYTTKSLGKSDSALSPNVSQSPGINKPKHQPTRRLNSNGGV